ncbi:Growth arrest-specific protein 8-like [Oopsacas minuta]|uniref:Dynein regulatory complex subunit 4 n=1 Tax=Oopsacas minuta TaxID=111878 RepID=A0AAV7JT87_9METZ|nr:Growth arrest-specific protein 8-like [Oopsacas minuta]
MPPKKPKKKQPKEKKEKKPVIVDGMPAEQMSPEQLLDYIEKLREEVDREREERNLIQLERDKINTFWDISKQHLDDCNSEIRVKERQIEEGEERHRVEIKVYKQKVKHLLYQHQNNVTELKGDGTAALKAQMGDQKLEEKKLHEQIWNLKSQTREGELSHEEVIRNLKREQDESITKMRKEYEQDVDEIQSKYETKMWRLREELEMRRKNEVHEVEERKNEQIKNLMVNHEKQFSDIKNYYNDITHNNLCLITTLKEKVEEMKKKEERLEKELNEKLAENRRLLDPLQRAKADVAELKRKLQNYEKDKISLNHCKVRLKAQDKELKSLNWEHEVLGQRYDKANTERDGLYNKFTHTIQEVQQKNGLKNLLLEKKLMSLAETLEMKEAQLNEVLSASNLDPNALTAVTRKLEDILDSKNTAIRDLQYELDRVCKAHNDLMRTYEAKLKAFEVPTEELGFKPLESKVVGHTLGKGPAGLVTAPP